MKNEEKETSKENEHLIKDGYKTNAGIDNTNGKNETFSLSINNSVIYSPKIAGLRPKYFHTLLTSRIFSEKSEGFFIAKFF